MQIPHPARILISLVALLAMAWVHASRPARGFECDCGGAPQFTMQDHCHGPHSAGCHEDAELASCHEHEDDSSDTHHHTALIDSLLALKADSSQFASVAATLNVVLEICRPSAAVSNGCVKEQRIVAHADGRRWPRILAHTIALRI